MSDTELFELCKEVARRTDWLCDEDMSDFYFYWEENEGGEFSVRHRSECPYYSKDEYYPLYNSDYLLDKLGSGAGVIKDSNGYTARRPSSLGAPENKDPLNGRVGWQSDTAVKALLTMIIDLERAGML